LKRIALKEEKVMSKEKRASKDKAKKADKQAQDKKASSEKSKPVVETAQADTKMKRWDGLSQGQVIKVMASKGYSLDAVRAVMTPMGFAPTENSLRVTYSEGVRDQDVLALSDGQWKKLRLFIGQQTPIKPDLKLKKELQEKMARRGKGKNGGEAEPKTDKKSAKAEKSKKADKPAKKKSKPAAADDGEQGGDEVPPAKKKSKNGKKKSKRASGEESNSEGVDKSEPAGDDFD
jgi:hypothetical protein